MPTIVDTSRQDPLIGFHFSLDIQGTVTGYFAECSGLGSESEVVEGKRVNDKGVQVVMKVPGRLKWGDVTLKRGVTADMQIWNWRKMIEDGDVKGARKNGSLIMYDQSLAPVAQWDFKNAWPSKVSGPAPKADSNELTVEELTIVHEYIVRVK
ncbi:MAG: phage tail protein [Chloroflexota bacterium]